MKRLTSFVVRNYAFTWFELRQRWRVTETPEVLFESYKRYRDLLPKEQSDVQQVIDRAYFWRHPHCLSLGCLASPIRSVREKTVKRLLNIRETEGNTTQSPVRVMEPPVDNLEASHFSKMILWDQSQVTGVR